MTRNADFHVVIVGGGIAGLATAFALRSEKRRITILERSRMLGEIGALISLQPNASKIVDKWNLSRFLQATEPLIDRAFRVFNTDGDCVRDIPLPEGQFGANRVLYHRQDLHAALKEAATDENIDGRPVEIRTGCRVVQTDCEAGVVTLDTGEQISGDIIIGADGIHSSVRTAVLSEEHKAIPTGLSAYRMLIPAENLKNVPAPKGLLNPHDPCTVMILGHDRRVIMGPGRGGKLYGVVALVPDDQMGEEHSSDSWVQPGSLGKLCEAYSKFPAWLHEIFEAASDIALWQLRDIDPLPTWIRGRTILIGDAAHAMLPTQGQGASQSIEDTEALKEFLNGVTTKAEVEAALRRIFAVRYERASLVQKYSREQAKPATEAESKDVSLDPAEFMRYNCDYAGAKDWERRKELRQEST